MSRHVSDIKGAVASFLGELGIMTRRRASLRRRYLQNSSCWSIAIALGRSRSGLGSAILTKIRCWRRISVA